MGSEKLLNERINNHFLIFTSLREERKMRILKKRPKFQSSNQITGFSFSIVSFGVDVKDSICTRPSKVKKETQLSIF